MSKKQRLLSTLILAQLYSALTIDVNDLACDSPLRKSGGLVGLGEFSGTFA